MPTGINKLVTFNQYQFRRLLLPTTSDSLTLNNGQNSLSQQITSAHRHRTNGTERNFEPQILSILSELRVDVVACSQLL